MRLATASFAYPQIDNAGRARLASALGHAGIPDGVFVLSTCLRVEVAAECDVRSLHGIVAGIFGPDAVEKADWRTGEAAAVHLFRVAAGLESPIVGERDVMTQFRGAVADAEERRAVGGLFAKLLENAVATAREVHRSLPMSAHHSIADVAAEMVSGSDRVAVLGSGTMAAAVAENLVERGVPVTVVARRPDLVSIPGVEVASFDDAGAVLSAYPAVVSATAAKHALVDDEDLRSIVEGRDEPLLLVDMAMPPDFVAPPGADVRYVDIDALAAAVAPQPTALTADAIACGAAVDLFSRLESHAAVAPVIAAMISGADDIVERVVGRFAGRLGDEADVAVLRQAVHTATRTLLSTPVHTLRDSDLTDAEVAGIAAAFDVDVDDA